jgi:hypothetical protein
MAKKDKKESGLARRARVRRLIAERKKLGDVKIPGVTRPKRVDSKKQEQYSYTGPRGGVYKPSTAGKKEYKPKGIEAKRLSGRTKETAKSFTSDHDIKKALKDFISMGKVIHKYKNK